MISDWLDAIFAVLAFVAISLLHDEISQERVERRNHLGCVGSH